MATDVNELPPGFAVDELPPGFTPDPAPTTPANGVDRAARFGLIQDPAETRQQYDATKKAQGPKDVLDFLMGAPRAGHDEGAVASALRKGIGVAEAVISKLTGATTGLAGGVAAGVDNTVKQVGYRAAGLDTSQLPSPGDAFDSGARAGTYEPRTETGQDILDSDAMREFDRASMALGPNPGAIGVRGMRAAQTTEAGMKPANLVRTDAALKTAKLEAPKNQARVDAIDAGFKLTPKAAGADAPSRAVQTAAGSPRLEQELSAHNNKTAANLAREDVGLADDVPLTHEATAQVRAEAGADYQAVKNVGRIELDSQLGKDLNRIAEPYVKGGEDFDALAKNPIIQTIEGLKKTEADTASVVEIVKDLRDKADTQFKPGGSKKLGQDYRAASQALDNAMDRSLGRIAEKQGDPDLTDAVTKYREARVRIAKTYLLDDAMDGAPGDVNIMTYARAQKKGAKLSGAAKQIADFGTYFGDEGLAKKAGKSGHVGPTYHDIVLAALHGAGGVLTVGARPGARAALGSDWMQRHMAAKARRALPPESAPEAPVAAPEPTLGQGFEPRPAKAAPAQPLGDLTPDWETAPGAGTPSAHEVVPTEGLVPALGEAPPMRAGPAAPAVRRGAGSDIPAVPGRPDLPDAMVVGGPAEVAPNAATGAAMQTPEASLARRQQGGMQADRLAAAERAAPVPKGEATEIKPQVVEPVGSPKFKEPPTEKLPVGESTEIKPEVAKPAGAPKTDARLSEIERLKAGTDSPVVRKALDERAAKVKKELKDQADAEQRRADAAELHRTAALTKDPELKAALFEKAKEIEKADAVPAAKVVEGQPEIKTNTPKSIPTGKTKELKDVPDQNTKQEAGSAGEARKQADAIPSKEKGAGKEGEHLADIDFPKLDETFFDHQQRAQTAREPAPVPAIVERGRRQARAALEKGAAEGKLGKDEADLALWALDKNPNLARGLRIETPKGAEGDIARGVYSTAERVVKLFQDKGSPERAAHEILHHSERMMPPEVQRGIRREWRRALDAEIRKAEPAQAEALRNISKGISGGQKEFEAMKQAFKDGTLDRDKHYQLTNPSEFWAVNAARILSEHHTGRNAWHAAAIRWMKDMVEHIKNTIGMRSDAPVLKALDEVLNPKANKGLDRSTSTLKTAEAKAMIAGGDQLPRSDRTP